MLAFDPHSMQWPTDGQLGPQMHRMNEEAQRYAMLGCAALACHPLLHSSPSWAKCWWRWVHLLPIGIDGHTQECEVAWKDGWEGLVWNGMV